MGCSDSRPKMSCAEERFYLGEVELKYGAWDCCKVDLVHRKYSFNGEVNENQWLDINRQLNLALDSPEKSFSSTIKSYYEQYKQNHTYGLRELLCLGIILSRGDNEKKSRLIFEAFVLDGSKEMSKEEISNVFDVLYDILVKKAELLAKDNPKVIVSPEKNKEFIKKMRKGKEPFKEKSINELLAGKNKVDTQQFVDWFCIKKNKDLLTSTGYRKALRTASNKSDYKSSKPSSSNP